MRSNLASAVVVLAAFAASLPGALACGIIGDVCCNVPDNNPNNGDCYEARGVCVDGWCTVDDFKNAAAAGEEECGLEGAQCCKRRKNGAKSARCLDDRNTCQDGTCMKCGVDGAPACNSKPKCEASLVKKDGMCKLKSSDQMGSSGGRVQVITDCGDLYQECCDISRDSLNDGFCFDVDAACWAGTCMPCGTLRKPACLRGTECEDDLVPNEAGLCSVDYPKGNKPTVMPDECGLVYEDCCDMNENDPSAGRCLEDDGRTSCFQGTCMPCSGNGQPMCNSKPYCEAGSKKKSGMCVPKKGQKDDNMFEQDAAGLEEIF